MALGPRLIQQPVPELREKFMEVACKSVGHVDFGPLDFIEPLEIMLHDLLHEAKLSPLGHLVTPYYLKQILRMRLRVQKAAETTQANDVRAPIFILGLPRTGSSLLHELLAQHHQLRAPTFWESHHWPSTQTHNLMTQAITRAQLMAVDVFAPTFRQAHALAALGPHECVSIQGYSFRSMQFHVAYRLPNYNRWMREACNWQPAYAWHEKHLSLLPHQNKRWILKAPGHMLGMQALLTQYPDARFIQTHRDPVEVIPSMASLTHSLRGIASTYKDPHEIGNDVHKLWHHGIEQVMLARAMDSGLNEKFIDINYRQLISDPNTALKRIIEFNALAWTPEFDALITNHLTKNPKHGKHTYTPEQFGLNPAHLNLAYADYTHQYL